jgi:1-acyl-sn-glycerol-3-phosphate acyltransferase
MGRWLIRSVVAPLYIVIMERILGWRVQGDKPPAEVRKFILLTEPHTSNWDLLVVLYWACKVRRQVRFVIKQEARNWFLVGRLLGWMGAVYIDRDAPLAALKTIIREAKAHDDFVLLVAPSGTRGYADGWKPGFYFIAQKTGLPLLPAGGDFARKLACIAPLFYPTGDIAADIEQMRPFYESITAKHPERNAPVRLVPDEKPDGEAVKVGL